MKILFVAPSNSVHTKRWIRNAVNSGFEVYFYDQIVGASSLGIDRVTEVPRQEPSFFKNLPRVTAEIFNLISNFYYLSKIRRDIKFDLVHIHWLFSSSGYSAAFVFPKILVATPWGSDVQYVAEPSLSGSLKNFLNKLYVRKILIKSKSVCCDSNLLKISLSNFGIDTKKVEVIYFGTDVDRFKPENRSEILRAQLGFSSENLVIISNRGHEPVYDIPTLIFAAPLVLSQSPNARFVIAGSGGLTSSYKTQIESLGLSEFFTFPGRLNDEDFINITASCDIYVSTSKSDGGLAASTAEAMASGLPVVISNFGENASWLDDNSAGLLFPIGDSSRLAKCLLDLISNDLVRIQMGLSGRKIIVERNNATIEWEKVVKMYSKVANIK